MLKKIYRDLMILINRIISFISYKDEGYIVFGEWLGNQANDSCVSLANYMADVYPEFEYYWIANKGTDLSRLNQTIKILEMDSDSAIHHVRHASVLVMNQGLSDFSMKDDFNVGGPLKINLWHGIAWKKIGIDGIPSKNLLFEIEHKLQIRSRNADCYVCPSEEFARIIKHAFLVKDYSLLRCGLPRNNLFYVPSRIDDCKRKICSFLGDSNAKIIVYLPTFRDNKSSSFSFSDINFDEFYEWLELNNIYLIQKGHFAERKQFSSNNCRIINTQNFSAQELMAASNMLITDYSSCFFDYLILDRPVIHYIYDYDYYRSKDRGLYYDVNSVACGSICRTVDELVHDLLENFENPDLYHELRNERKRKFLEYDTSSSCEIIARKINEEIRRRGQ